jgi:hypothetical protein
MQVVMVQFLSINFFLGFLLFLLGFSKVPVFLCHLVLTVRRKLHNQEFNDLYCSPSIVQVIQSRMSWAGL